MLAVQAQAYLAGQGALGMRSPGTTINDVHGSFRPARSCGRTHAIDADELARVAPGQNGIFLPLVVTNGRIVGTWRKKISTSGLTGALFDDPITATGRAHGEKAQRGFSRALQDYAKFLAVPLNPA